MLSLYARYLDERTDDSIIETEYGFATYRYLKPRTVYIIDLYVLPEHRKKGIASQLADKICAEAKIRDCIELLGTVVPFTYGATESILTLIAYGMKVRSSCDNLIIFKKDI